MQLPSFIGKYELLEFLGGGMSEVYRARDTVIDRPVVVKLLTVASSADAEAKARFLQEARVAGKIQHENIVSVFDFGEHEGRPFIVMEYLKGGDLRSAIAAGRTGSLEDRVRVALQLALALDFVHRLGVVHRDIKPENINVDPSGRIKLMDFGIAKTADLSLTRTGVALGTPYYMAPEQVSGQPAGTLVDVYAFGMLFFELLTGVRGVTGETVESVFYQILSQPLDAAIMENAGVPAAVRDLVMRCTAKNPAERPQGFDSIAIALRAILENPEAGRTQARSQPDRFTEDEPTPSTPEERATARSMWQLSLVTYGLVLLVTGMAVGAWWFLQPPEAIPGMRYIEPGSFPAGADKRVVALKGFYIDETEVTNAEFGRYCRTVGQTSGCAIPTGTPNLPVVNVSYAQARAYAKSYGKRLPTPLEWERAARGTKGDLFPWGDAEDRSLANLRDNPQLEGNRGLKPARSFLPYHGLYQMVGNAWEMVEGEVKPSAQAQNYFSSIMNPAPRPEDPWITIRGGSFNFDLTPGILYDSSTIPETYTGSDIGFRCVKDP